jgi:cholesterol transport system auxiliary component
MRRALCASAVAAPLVLLTGCSLWPAVPVEDRVRHVLNPRPRVATSATRNLVLAVNPPLASPGFESSAIAYVQAPHVLDHYATHEWAETPARMIGQLLTRTLEDTGGFRAVVRKASGLPADLALDTQIVLLQQSFLTKPSVVELTLRVQLVEVARRRVLATRYIEIIETAPSDDAPGGVVAANAAVASGLTQVAAFCIDAAADRLLPLTGRP